MPAGGSDSYTFTAGNPGTYLYEAGTNSGRPGRHGPLRSPRSFAPTAGAYGTADTEYDVEEILVLSEIDPYLNNYPDPNDFDFVGDPDDYTAGYHPTYFLINGEAYPDTDAIAAADGDRVLLRYLNAGLSHHTMTLLGEHQRVIAKDAHPTGATRSTPSPRRSPPGSTLDTIATLDTTAQRGQASALQPPTQRDEQRRLPGWDADLHRGAMTTIPGGRAARASPRERSRAAGRSRRSAWSCSRVSASSPSGR